ncbi:MAG TPA: tetratricopeptide repeat protein [Methylomirabilota bacterium]|nr:tetratricopeptide repeat protein [Methylomirabilota bacterium]
MFGLFFDLPNAREILANPFGLLLLAFQIWMLVDAIRRQEWLWVIFLIIFPFLNAVLYFILVYWPARSVSAGPRLEIPGSAKRARIKELEAQIHHLDKAHHHAELGRLLLEDGKHKEAEQRFRAALERDPEDIDTQASLGRCFLQQARFPEARQLLAHVCAVNPKHGYGETMMDLADTQMKLGETDAAIASWAKVLEHNSYARARVQLAELLRQKGRNDEAAQHLKEVIADAHHGSAFQQKLEKQWVRRAKSLLSEMGRS